MNCKEVMKKLESLGSQQTRKTYARHGVRGDCFGVKYGDLYKVVKSIGADHPLAMELWKTGNHDARVLATMIADPQKTTAAELDRWAKTADNQLALDSIAALASKTKHARRCFEKWIESRDEWTAASGWHLLASLAGGGRSAKAAPDEHQISDAECSRYLDRIEREIHKSPNRVRHSMNTTLIAIGIRGGALQKDAIAAAKRIGRVEVDHGDTACETPDAAKYIEKTVSHRNRKKSPAKDSGPKKKTPRKAAASAR